MSGKSKKTDGTPQTDGTPKVDGRKGRKMSSAQKEAMTSARKANAATRKAVTEAVLKTPEVLVKPSIWKNVPEDVGTEIVAAIQKSIEARKTGKIAELKAQLAKLEGTLTTENTDGTKG